DRGAERRKGGAPGRTRQTSRARERGRERDLEQTRALEDFGQRAGHDVERKTDRERHQERASAFHGEDHGNGDRGDARGADQTLSDAEQVAALPGKQRTKRHGDEEGNEQRGEGGVEERRADGNFLACERLEHERIERTDEHGGTSTHQEEVVEHQRAFARNRREQAPLFEQGRAQREQRKAATDEQQQDRQDEDAARRVGGEGVH